MKKDEIEFRRIYGVKLNTFNKMVSVIKIFENTRKKQSGRPLKLTYNKQVKMYLIHLKQDVTFIYLANIYGISEANCWKIIKKIESILLESESFEIVNHQNIDKSTKEILIDATEVEVQNFKENKNLYSGKKKKLF